MLDKQYCKVRMQSCSSSTVCACDTERTAYLTDLLDICIGQPGVAVLLSKGNVLAQHVLAEHSWISHLWYSCCNLLGFLHNGQGRTFTSIGVTCASHIH